jgi:hypothetical protein
MEKIIIVGEHQFPAKSTAASLFRYKSNFNRDGIKDLIALANSIPDAKKADTDEDVQKAFENITDDFELDVFFRFLWVFAKTADSNIPPMEEWLDTIDMPPLDFAFGALPQVVDMLGSTIKSSVKSKNLKAAGSKGKKHS